MNFWIFKCNPNRFRIDQRLQDPDPAAAWLVTRYRDEITPGDVAFIWRTGLDGGIRAVMQIQTRPEMLPESPRERQHWVDQREATERLRVTGVFTHRIPCLTRDELADVPALQNLSVFHGFQQGTNFRVTQPEGQVIMRLIEARTAT